MPRTHTPKRLPARNGWGVAIMRDDGSEFLSSGSGVLPHVVLERKYAVAHKRELLTHHFKCRVVRVRFTNVTFIPLHP